MDTDELIALNDEIAVKETDGDAAWFDRLLAPEFAMRRASGAYVGRAAFVDAVRKSAERTTRDIEVRYQTDLVVAVDCVVSMLQDDGRWKDFRNCRLFCRSTPTDDWQLVGWANEPA